jgi:tetratricopeptide (TPR) repeat protein
VLALLACVLGATPNSKAQNFDAMGQLVVRVRSAGLETPLAQVRVELVKFPSGVVGEQFTGSDGSVQFSSISVGAYTIRATRQGYQTGQATADFRRGDATQQHVDIVLQPQEGSDGGSTESSVAVEDLKIPPKAKKEFERGKRLLNEEKKPQESISAFQNAIDAYPDYYDAYVLMGTAQMQAGSLVPAETSLRKAISLDAKKTGPYYPLAMVLFSQKKYSDEQSILLDAKALDPSDWRWTFELARADAQQGNWPQALQSALDVKKMPNAPTKIHLLLGDIYSNTGRLKESIDELELFVHLDPQSPFVPRIQQVLPELRKKLAAGPAEQP